MSARGFDARVLRDARRFINDGEHWSVSERDASGVPGAHAPSCLVFESQVAVRRTWSFPRNWRDMEDKALWRLSELTAGKSPLIDSLQTAFITSIVAQRTASTLIATTRVILDENRALRSELRAKLQQCREARRVSKECVANYAREQRGAGRTATDVMKSLHAPLQQTAFVVSDPCSTTHQRSWRDSAERWATHVGAGP